MAKNRTACVILGLLSIEPNQSGYDIRKAVENSVGYFWNESFGQIYPTLKRLVAEGLIVPSISTSSPKKRRQEYALTEAGHTRLKNWLAEPFQNDPPRNEFLLKLFFGREAVPDVSIGHIRSLQEKNRRMLATLMHLEKLARTQGAQNPHQPFWLLTLGLGVAMTRAALDWGEAALAQLSSTDAPAETNQSSFMNDSPES